jgi:hypothetical protein
LPGGSIVSDKIDALLRQLLTWLSREEQPYADVMEAWRTSCPQLPIWEEANERGFVDRAQTDGRAVVRITSAGRAFLAEAG